MSYASNVVRDSSENGYFVTLYPRELLPIAGRSLYSGSTYKVATPRPVVAMETDFISGVTFTEGTSKVLADLEFYYDMEEKTLYWRCDTLGADNLTFAVVVTVELFLSTKETMWYRDPLDETSPIVKWSGCIKTPPEVSMISDLQNFGFVPIDVTQMTCTTDREIFQSLVHNGSFNSSDVIVWHQCGELDIDNIERILSGSIDKRIRYDNSQITFPISDRFVDFDQPITYGDDGDEFFDEASFGSSQIIDPDFVDKPIRTVYGVVQGFTPVNVDYNSDAPTTSNNRDWVVGRGQGVDYWDSYSAVCTGSTANTNFKLAYADGKFFALGDRVWIDKATDQWASISTTSDDGAGNFIFECFDITSSTFSGTLTGATISKSYVRTAYLVDTENTHWYQLEFGRDYTEATFAQNTSGITLRSTAESNAGAPTYNPVSHHIFFDVGGKQTLPTIGGIDFDQLKGVAGSYSTDPDFLNTYGAFNRISMVIYDFLKSEFGLDESVIDTDRLLALDQLDFSRIAAVIPQTANATDFPTYKEVLNELLVGCFSKGFYDQDGVFTIRTVAPIVASDMSFEKEDMIDASWEYDYSSMANISIKLSAENILVPTYGTKIGLTDFHTHFKFYQDQAFDHFGPFSNGTYGRLLNRITNTTAPDQKLFVYNDGLPDYPTERMSMLASYFDRSCKLTFTTRNNALSLNIGDAIKVTRDDLPGFDPDGSMNSIFLTIVGIKKGNGEVEITADDQRLIQAL